MSDLVQRLRDPRLVLHYGDRHAIADRIEADRGAMQQALEALTESRDTVWNDYAGDWRHGMPTRKAQLDGMKEMCEAHDAAIVALQERLK